MTTAVADAVEDRDWLPILESATQEVFEIMLGGEVKVIPPGEQDLHGGFTAIVGIAGALCGVVTVRCGADTANQIARAMLGDASAEGQEVDAIGEMCNMIAGNFESGLAQMKSTSMPAFDRIANMLAQRHYRLRIEGHTDNVPIRTAQFPSNWELSASRATEIVRLLIVRDGFAPDHLSAGGFAEYHPVASNTTPEGRGMNRRVDIVVLGAAPKEPPAAQTAAGVHDRNPSAMPAATVPASKTTEPLPIAAPKATMINAAHDPSQN